jgi:drug/metabolite transporter (DMT)-like permease
VLELRGGDARMTRIDARTALLMTLPPLLWAGNAVVGRLAVGSVSPLALNFMRWALAAMLLAPLGWRALARPREIAVRWRHLLVLGVLGVGLYNSLQYLALVSSTPINVTLIAASLPLWMLAVGALVHREHPTRRQLVGALLSLSGVLLVICRGDPASLASLRLVPGDLYILGATIAWAFYSWLLVRPPASMRGAARPGWNWAEFLFVQVVFGAAVAGLAAGGEAALGAAAPRWDAKLVATLLYVAIGPSIIAYRCWGLGVARGGPALAAFFSNLTPLFAALLSSLVLGEAPRWYHGLAFALIAGGIVVSSRIRPAPSANGARTPA